ncbi:MAG: leishmanolysin-related zinc metalloendopeptidase [Gemmatimonadales bacterium]
MTGLGPAMQYCRRQDGISGAAYPNAKVPVEDQGGPGTADAHWRKSVFDNEIMTGWLNQGVNPLSAMSIASMADAGYTVALSAADAFSITTALREPGPRVMLHLQNDIAAGAIGVLDRNGKVTRYLHR